MKSFVLNRHGALVLPANLFAQLDFSVITSLGQFEAIVKRDMESKAPTGTEILELIEASKYRSRIELLRDVALNLYWVNRYTLTLYQKRPMRWRDVPRDRHDLPGFKRSSQQLCAPISAARQRPRPVFSSPRFCVAGH
jgi:3-oxoacyl-[acyl-carrier-protein] synthase-3